MLNRQKRSDRKGVKIWPSLWELSVIEMVLMDHFDPMKENSV